MSSNSGGGGGGAIAAGDSSAQTGGTSASGSGPQQQISGEPDNQRFSSLIHDSEVFLTKLGEFKPQSLGCLEARRKSSSTLIFPSPQQACMGPPKCPKYPHDVKPTPGYWIECHGPGILTNKASGSVATTQEHASSSSRQAQDDGSNQGQIGNRRPSDLFASGDHQLMGTSSIVQNIPTTPTADRILTRHEKEIVSDQDEMAELIIQSVLKRRQSLDQIELQTSTSSDVTRAHQHAELASLDAPSRQTRYSSSSPDPAVANDQSTLSRQVSMASAIAGSLQAKYSEMNNARTVIELRKRLNKRTMTRDDIDLHKARRGTPNITITEPSFNQSTVTYQPSVRQRGGLIRQGSRETEIKRTESIDSSQKPTEPQPIKFHIQRYMSIEGQQSRDEQSREGDGENFIIKRQSSLEATEEFAQDLISSRVESLHKFQHHRPSIIREDIDSECIATAESPTSGTSHEQKELYCGLSTTTFTKKPYQQTYQELQNLDQFKDSSLELISFEEENYEKHYYGREHWNYFTNDELLGPVMLSLKQEVNNQRDHFHVLLRTVSYTLHGTIPASTICADRYDREAIVRELSEIAKLKPPLMLGQLPSTPDELLKLDHIFIKTELKVGVIYIKSGQAESEEAILGNKEESPLFTEFLDLLGDRITLKGFDRYKGGLDTVHNLTGTESVYTMWRNIEIMFHVSTMLPHEENDPQKLQKKRHIGNDIVCVAFIESDDTKFWPGCIKSYFLHTFIAVRTSPKPLKEGEKRKYSVSCVCRNEVQYAFRPYLVEQDEFFKSDYFREWLLVKIVNGERASYSAPKFARMQDRTRSQLLEDIITNLANHLVTGQIPKPYRRGSWRPLGHTRASSPLEDSMKDYFEDYDQLAKDFCHAFCGPSRSMLCDVVFKVKDTDGTFKLVHGVRAIMAIRSRTFLEMLYGFLPPGTGPTSIQNQTNLRAIEMKALSGESSSGGGKEVEGTKSLLAKRGSVGADSSRKTGEKERRQSMLPNLSKSISQKPNYLTVPNTTGGGGTASGGSGTGGMIKNAFNRLVSGNWSGWSGNIKGYKGEHMHIKVDQIKSKVDLNSLAICKEIAKIDAEKLAQREFEIKEFDYETFQQTIEYIHNGQCKLSYETIPGLICAAEHYDLPDLLHACFHHANTHMRLNAAPRMMNALYQNSCFYITAMQLLDSIYEYIDPHGTEFFSRPEYLELYESVFTTLLTRKTLQVSELKKFQSMDGWAKQQVADKLRHKQQLHRQQSSEQPEEQIVDLPTSSGSIEPAVEQINTEEAEADYRNLMIRLNKEVNIKLDKISNEDLVKVVLPTKVFKNDKIFEVMADESRNDY